MKKPHYPQWLQVAVLFICVAYLVSLILSFKLHPPLNTYELALTGTLSGAYIALVIGMLSALFILREKESLYLIVLVSCMTLFFEMIVGLRVEVLDGGVFLMYIVLLGVHIAVLADLSYMCFGAIMGGGNYNKEKKSKKKKKK